MATPNSRNKGTTCNSNAGFNKVYGGAICTIGTFTAGEGGLTATSEPGYGNVWKNDHSIGGMPRPNPISQVVSSYRSKNANQFYGSYMLGLLNASYNGNTGHLHVTRPNASDVFAKKMDANIPGISTPNWIGTLMATKLGGVSSTILQTMGAYPKKGRNWPSYRNWRWTQLMVTTGWSRSTGAFLTATPLNGPNQAGALSSNISQTKDYFGNNYASPGYDLAAQNNSGTLGSSNSIVGAIGASNSTGFSRIPGRFAYITSSKIPTIAEYTKGTLD